MSQQLGSDVLPQPQALTGAAAATKESAWLVPVENFNDGLPENLRKFFIARVVMGVASFYQICLSVPRQDLGLNVRMCQVTQAIPGPPRALAALPGDQPRWLPGALHSQRQVANTATRPPATGGSRPPATGGSHNQAATTATRPPATSDSHTAAAVAATSAAAASGAERARRDALAAAAAATEAAATCAAAAGQ
jgi:hypothetical protein